MKKNVASQVIGAQMVSATDGSAFTGEVTCYVTGDGGAQAAGSVGSGICTHEGNGFHSYAPSQAETNYDHIAFTFIGTGAVPATVQIYTDYPQTGDAYSRLGSPAGASIAADVAVIDTVADGIKAKTDNLPGDPADQSLVIAATDAIMSRLGAPAGATIAADIAAVPAAAAADILETPANKLLTDASGYVTANVTGSISVTGDVTLAESQPNYAPAKASDVPTAAAIRAEIDSNSAQLAAIVADTNEIQAELANGGRTDLLIDAIKGKTDNLPTDPADESLIIAAADALGVAITALGSPMQDGTSVEVSDKTGFSLASTGLDAVAAPADLANDAAARATFVGMVRALFNRFFNKVTQTATQQKIHNDAGAVISTKATSDDETTQTLEKSA